MSDEPVTRAELERALRFLNSTVTQMRGELLELAAQVVTLTRQLEERGAVSQEAVLAALPAAVAEVRAGDEASPPLRVELGDSLLDKHQVASPPIPCAELIPICRARCCTLSFALSTQDLEQGRVRWDLGRPYLNLRRADGYCVHNEPAGGCSIYPDRPVPCRAFDCRGDRRIWLDYERRLPAPEQSAVALDMPAPRRAEEVAESARARRAAFDVEEIALRNRR